MQDERNNDTAREQMAGIVKRASKEMNAPVLTDVQLETQSKRNRLIRLSDVGDLVINWLWEPYIQLGNITILRGLPGVGKTFLISALIGAVSSKVMPNGMPGTLRKTDSACIYYGNEDDPETIKTRVKSACAPGTYDLSKLSVVTDPTSFKDLDTLRTDIIETGAVLVIFDPLQAYLGDKVDMNRANETRPVLENLRRLAKETECAILIIEHMNKNTNGDAINRGIGSMDITAVARSVLMIVRDTDDNSNLRYTFQIKTNSKQAPTAVWTITDSGIFEWKGSTTLTLDDLQEQRIARRSEAVRLAQNAVEKSGGTWKGTTTDLINQCNEGDPDSLSAGSIGKALRDPKIVDQLEKLYGIRVSTVNHHNKSVHTLENIDR